MFFQSGSGGGCMPEEKCDFLSSDDAKKLLLFFNKNKSLAVNKKMHYDFIESELIVILLKVNFLPGIINVSVPEGLNLVEDGLHVYLTEGGAEKLEFFL